MSKPCNDPAIARMQCAYSGLITLEVRTTKLNSTIAESLAKLSQDMFSKVILDVSRSIHRGLGNCGSRLLN